MKELHKAVALSVIINFVLLGASYGIYLKGTADGRQQAVESLNAQLPKVQQAYMDAGAKAFQDQLLAKCQESPQKSLTINCGDPTEEQNAD